MATTHFVRDFGFDIAFASESEAFEQHARLGSFVSERLVAVAEEVFRRLDPVDGSVLRIDEMEIDLGDISLHEYYEQAEQRFRKQLEEQIQHKLRLLDRNILPPGGKNSESIVTAAQNEFEIVVWSLEHGYLPWNLRSIGVYALEEMLRRVVEHDGPRLSSLLRRSERVHDIARRLAWQAPSDLLNAVAKMLRPGTLIPSESDDWESVLIQLLSDEHDVYDLQSIIETAIATGKAEILDAYWPRLFREDADLLESVVRQHGVRQEVRQAMATGFPDQVLGAIVQVLEPQEADFIGEVTGRAEIFRDAAREHNESTAETKAHLWEFTLSYLLVERGGRFNRRSYLESTLRRMSAHYNTGYGDLLTSLVEVVDRIDAASALKIGMLSLLSDLRQDVVAPPQQSVSVDFISALQETAEKVEVHIRQESDFRGLSELLAYFTHNYLTGAGSGPLNKHSYIASLVRQTADYYKLNRKAVIEGIEAGISYLNLTGPFAMELISILSNLRTPWRRTLNGPRFTRDTRLFVPLMEIIDRIESESALQSGALSLPSELRQDSVSTLRQTDTVDFISALMQAAEEVERQLRHQAGFRGIAKLLAKFTHIYIANNQDRDFDKHAYIASLIWQTADHYKLSRRALLNATTVTCNQIELPASFESQLLPILRDLQAPWSKQVEEALLSGDTRLLRRIAADEYARSAMIEFIRPEVLRDLAQMVEPASAALMCELADQPHLFEDALPGENQPAICRALWEFTLTYAIVDRGSSFNRRSYAEWVIRKLAAHHNLHYEDLLVSLSSAIGRTSLFGQANSELASILSVLAEREKCDIPQTSAGQPHPEAQRDLSLVHLFAEIDETPSTKFLQTFQARLSQWLLSPVSSNPVEQLQIVMAIDRLIDRSPDWFRNFLRSLLADPVTARSLIERLAEQQLARLLLLIAPGDAQNLMRLAQVIADTVPDLKPELRWQFLFAFLVAQVSPISDKAFVRQYVAWLAGQTGSHTASDLALLAAQRLRMTTTSTGDNERRRLIDLLEQATRRPVPVRKSRPVDFSAQEIFVHNAGQVLAGPYLPRLFAMTGLLEENKFRDNDAAYRGIHLLQYLVDGSLDSPEYLLPLNKILCGLRPDEPIKNGIMLTQTEKDATESLLHAMIAHWSILGSTSVQGLRESFLQREGRLSFQNDAWRLLVQPRAFDMLLDKLPWGFKVVKYSWMQSTLYVEWR
ncbi:MAG: contractile injection system tape measure protein [Terracidiphilus sp.]|jgi:hypothetical protein